MIDVSLIRSVYPRDVAFVQNKVDCIKKTMLISVCCKTYETIDEQIVLFYTLGIGRMKMNGK